jgi:alkylation response protein AidB-like acyl-CoA dehydrogenase
MAALIFASESLVYRVAGMIDDRLETIPKGMPDYYDAYQQGIEEYASECAITKVFCTEVLAAIVDEVLQVHGGYGFVQEYPAERFYRDERINRIYEGTNEINRILIAGTLLKRLTKDGAGFGKRVEEALDAMKNTAPAGHDAAVDFSGERAVLRNLKRVFLALAGTGVKAFRDRIKDEQEFLMALADVAIHIFAIESAVSRAAKIHRSLSPEGKESVRAAVKIVMFQAVETVATSARKAAFSIGEDYCPEWLARGIRTLAEYDAPGLIASKRKLADAAIDAEKYIF